MRDKYNKISRREVLRLATLGTLGAFIAACQRAVAPATSVPTVSGSAPAAASTKEVFSQGAPPPYQPQAVNGIPITSNDNFYTVAYRDDEPPQIPPNWKLALTGQVDRPVSLSLDDIKAMAPVTQMRTLECISNPVGGDLISNAEWKGIRLKDLLANAGVKSGVKELKLESFDGYSTAIPLELGMDEDSLLVYEMNGEALPAIHGAPLRCLWPGHYGMKQPKWIQTITAITEAYAGYWEKQGWSYDASIRPFSRIDLPQDGGTVPGSQWTLSGIAFTGAAGLAKLEVSWDDTNEWHVAELTRGPSPYVWTLWKWTGAALPAGRHQIFARATDKSGAMQVRGQGFNLLGGTFPNGTADMQSIVLDFKS
jgi:DMSO/TMAO reductase YedYZ molybdopterin-dependent catalytic subunit